MQGRATIDKGLWYIQLRKLKLLVLQSLAKHYDWLLAPGPSRCSRSRDYTAAAVVAAVHSDPAYHASPCGRTFSWCSSPLLARD